MNRAIDGIKELLFILIVMTLLAIRETLFYKIHTEFYNKIKLQNTKQKNRTNPEPKERLHRGGRPRIKMIKDN